MLLETIQHLLDVLITQSLSCLQLLLNGLLLIGLLLLQSLARLLNLLSMNLYREGEGYRSIIIYYLYSILGSPLVSPSCR